jgi:hypothetical protein
MGREGLALDSTSTRVMLSWSLVFPSGPRPVDVRGSSVEVPAMGGKKKIFADAFCRLARRMEEG